MNITVNSQQLAAKLRLMSKVVPSKPAIAILNHALMRADGSTLHLYATDLEVGLSASCDAQITEPGTVALPVARLLSLVEQFPDADVIINHDGPHVALRCGAFRSRLQAMPTEDFPKQADPNGVGRVVNAAILRQMIQRTRYAINTASTKYILKGALFTVAGEGAAMVATDGKRLAIATSAAKGEPCKVVIPAKTLDILDGLLDAGNVEIIEGNNHLHFIAAGCLLTSRMIEEKFPAYERIVPMSNHIEVQVDRSMLMAAMKRIVLVSEVNKAVYLHLAPGKLELTSQSAEVGAAAEAIAVVNEVELKVCISGEYLLDFLGASAGVQTTIKFKDANGAVLLLDGEDHVGVVMLMKG